MIRIVLTWVLPLLLPTIVYFLWVGVARKRQAAGGPQVQDVPWTWLLGAGVALAALISLATVMMSDYSIDRDYSPAYLGEDGKVVPGEFK